MRENILAIDPGPDYSGVCLMLSSAEHGIGFVETTHWRNKDRIEGPLSTQSPVFENPDKWVIAIETIQNYGKSGDHIFHTCMTIGRLLERFEDVPWVNRVPVVLVKRSQIKKHLCGKVNGMKDKHVRQALIDRFPKTGKDGKGECSAIGTKDFPGPLYRIKGGSHGWAALGLAATVHECGWEKFLPPPDAPEVIDVPFTRVDCETATAA